MRALWFLLGVAIAATVIFIYSDTPTPVTPTVSPITITPPQPAEGDWWQELQDTFTDEDADEILTGFGPEVRAQVIQTYYRYHDEGFTPIEAFVQVMMEIEETLLEDVDLTL